MELSIREKSGLQETERQLQLKIKTLQSCLKTEKDEVRLHPVMFTGFCEIAKESDQPACLNHVQVQKLQNIIASRASQYSHDAKRKEREAAKLKERLSQLLVDRKDKKLCKPSTQIGLNPCVIILLFKEIALCISKSCRHVELPEPIRWKKKPLEKRKSDNQVFHKS